MQAIKFNSILIVGKMQLTRVNFWQFKGLELWSIFIVTLVYFIISVNKMSNIRNMTLLTKGYIAVTSYLIACYSSFHLVFCVLIENKSFYHDKAFRLEFRSIIFSDPCQTSKMNLFAKIANGWKLHLRCLTRFWIDLWLAFQKQSPRGVL